MNADIASTQTSDERELNRKLEELATLENELTERELELSTVYGELRRFERDYLRTVGVRYAELDDLQARIAEAEARHSENDRGTQDQARAARARAERSAQETIIKDVRPPAQTRPPSDGLKALYRQVARLHHPDLTTDDAERARRHEAMAEINHAYQNGDEARLRVFLHNPRGDGERDTVGASLVRIIRKIAQVEDRLRRVRLEIVASRSSALCVLHERVKNARLGGRDLLSEMEADIRKRMAARQTIWLDLWAKGHDHE
jgi:hypothetical protein